MQLVRESRGTGVQIRLPLAPESPAAGSSGAALPAAGLAGCRAPGMTRRRRGVLMLGLAAVCAGLAASIVDRYADDVAAQVGPLQDVVVARRDVPRGTLVTPAVARAVLEQRRVPLRFAPPRSLRRAAVRRSGTARSPRSRPATTWARRSSARRGRGPRRSAKRRAGAWSRWRSRGRGRSRAALRPGALVDVLVTTDGEQRVAAHVSGAPAARARRLSRLVRRGGARWRGRDRDGAHDAASGGDADRGAELRARGARRPAAAGDVRRLGPTSVTASALGR